MARVPWYYGNNRAGPIGCPHGASAVEGPKGLAEYLDLSLGDLLEGIVLHAFEQKLPFDDATIATVERLKTVYGLDLTAADSHHLREADEKGAMFDEHRRV